MNRSLKFSKYFRSKWAGDNYLLVWDREGERMGSAHHRSALCDRSPRCCPRRRCLRMVWGAVSGGAVGLEQRGSCQALQTLLRGNNRKASPHLPFFFFLKKGLQQLWWTKNGAVRFAHTLSKMSSTEATPERMVVVQQKELSCSSYYHCAYDINALNKVRFFHTLSKFEISCCTETQKCILNKYTKSKKYRV